MSTRRYCGSGMKSPGLPVACRSFSFTVGPTMCAPGTECCRRCTTPATVRTCHGFAVTVQRDFCATIHFAAANSSPWARTRRVRGGARTWASCVGRPRLGCPCGLYRVDAERIASERVCRVVGWLWHQHSKSGDELSSTQNYWYHWLMATPRGETTVREDRRAFTRHIWNEWFVAYKPDDGEFERTAVSFDNPDWADVVLHSYRVALGPRECRPSLRQNRSAASIPRPGNVSPR